MTKAELKKVTGFDTWLQLYQLLKQDGNDRHETIKISPPIHRQHTDKPEVWEIRVNEENLPKYCVKSRFKFIRTSYDLSNIK